MERNQKHDLFLPLALFADRALPIRECAAFALSPVQPFTAVLNLRHSDANRS